MNRLFKCILPLLCLSLLLASGCYSKPAETPRDYSDFSGCPVFHDAAFGTPVGDFLALCGTPDRSDVNYGLYTYENQQVLGRSATVEATLLPQEEGGEAVLQGVSVRFDSAEEETLAEELSASLADLCGSALTGTPGAASALAVYDARFVLGRTAVSLYSYGDGTVYLDFAPMQD